MKQFQISFDELYCKGCDLCVNVCPKDALLPGSLRNAKGYLVPDTKPDLCNGCRMCEHICPDFAIVVKEVK